ncbi:hypothetical protein PENSPDRAFT_757594 [Peniophora sp. CONT]|nr:hypothetical protein PENSPDRAFT_757594 [Peniophora sp. CONT]
MSNAAHSASGVVDAKENAANKGRLVIGDKLKENAKGAVKTTIELLGIAARMTQSVPYLGAISTALTEFMKIQNEVDQCKEECKEAVDDAEQINALIKRFKDECIASGRGESALNETLCEAFAELEKIVLDCVTTLQECKTDSKRKRDRLRIYWKRSDLLKSVKGCATEMRKALGRFDRTLNVDAAFMLKSIEVKVDEIRVMLQSPSAPQETMTATSSVWRLRAANLIFYGRESEVEATVDLIVNKAPARVAILGPGGIGKTSIALAVLHNPKVKELYGNHRCFMSCEATTTADAVVRALADALGFTPYNHQSLESACHSLIQYLAEESGIICFDNLETPLDADKRAVEELLNGIAALPSVALLITSRDTSIPTLKWTSPRLGHIETFSRDAALATWDDICDVHDEYTEKLIEAVDCMPLAVTLLARLASIEQNTKLVWDRWRVERTDMIRDGDQADRLYSVSASIELSLRNRTEASALLGFVCMFPYGFPAENIALLDEGLKNPPESARHSLALLKRLSLVYYTESPWWNPAMYHIRVLSPIRHYILQHYISDDLFLKFTDIVMQKPKVWNYHDVLSFGWNRPHCRERCFEMVLLFCYAVEHVELLSQAIEKARELEEPRIQSRLHRQLGEVLYYAGEDENSRSAFTNAMELDEQMGDREALLKDLTEWISSFKHEFDGREDKFQRLDEVQHAIQKAWDLGRDENKAWDGGFYAYRDIARVQHFVNEGRRKLQKPVVHRSGLYSDNASTVDLQVKSAYDELVHTSPPPWDLSLILDTIETLHSAARR